MISRDRCVIRLSQDITCINPVYTEPSALICSPYGLSIKLYLESIFRTLKLPWITQTQPLFRKLDLCALDYLLFEYAIIISDTITGCRYPQRCHRIKKTGSQTSKTTVTQARIYLLITYILKIITKPLKGLFALFF